MFNGVVPPENYLSGAEIFSEGRAGHFRKKGRVEY
jgi:hypothetical protein